MSLDVKEISDSELITILNEIYDWKQTGELDQRGIFKTLFNKHRHEFQIFLYLEDRIMFEAHSRFNKIVKCLLCKNPGLYIK